MTDSELDHRLRNWSAPDIPADEFRREVWQRIARCDSRSPRLLRWLDALLRPGVAVAALAAALLVGGAGGVAHAALKQKTAPVAAPADSSAVYVDSINPLNPAHLHLATHAGDIR